VDWEEITYHQTLSAKFRKEFRDKLLCR
jgi:hypothetical protein